MTHRKHLLHTTLILAGLSLGACSAADRIANIGKPPAMTKIENPVMEKNYQPVSLPMPAPRNALQQNNSLWASDRQTFFKDQRANDIGDIITVLIKIDDQAKLDNTTERSRDSNETASLPALLGYEQSLNRYLPQAIDNTNLADIRSDSNHTGDASIDREEQIEVQLAALITQILPNGNMVIHGKQEVVVNYEKRLLAIDGVIRPQDISIKNTISYEQIAEARIAYGGEGQLMDVQQPRYGQQLYDIVFPF
jgi:flagellar L-ring protein precursor FlgH